MDILYLVKKTANNEELKYSLRSLSNIKHNKVFIIGDLPNFINPETVFYIPAPTLDDRYETTTNHIKIACSNDLLSEDFILMNDDFFFLDKITYEELNLNRGLMLDVVRWYHENHTTLSRYDNLVEQAYNQLKQLDFKESISFELHIPMIINKLKFNAILPKINSLALHCCKRSLYGNYFIKDSKTISDVKVLANMNFSPDNLLHPKLMSVSDFAFDKIESFLQEKFPDKSIYEF